MVKTLKMSRLRILKPIEVYVDMCLTNSCCFVLSQCPTRGLRDVSLSLGGAFSICMNPAQFRGTDDWAGTIFSESNVYLLHI